MVVCDVVWHVFSSHASSVVALRPKQSRELFGERTSLQCVGMDISFALMQLLCDPLSMLYFYSQPAAVGNSQASSLIPHRP